MRRLFVLAIVLLLQGRTMLGIALADGIGEGPPNVPMPTLGGRQFWSDQLFFQGWHIQRNSITGYYRLLDEHDFRHAWGTLTDCRTALERIKRDRHLPRMRGKAVILLHGLFRSSASMEKLAKCLREQGHDTVFNVTYASTQSGVGEHAESLARIIANLDGIEEINIVAHSMGNIVARRYLADHEDKPDPRLRRMVMLGPPNHGSLGAVVLAENAIFTTLTGQAGQELGIQWGDLEERLATPTFEFGIIAGGKQDDRGFNPLLPGDNDAIISVDTTRLAGASDFIIVPVIHSFLMDDARVGEYTLRFLQKGHFVSREERHALTN